MLHILKKYHNNLLSVPIQVLEYAEVCGGTKSA